jgi:DNA-binding response OmpR family regulator
VTRRSMAKRRGILVGAIDPGICRLFRRHFANLGFAVVIAHGGRALLEQIRRADPEMVIFSAELMDQGTADLVREVRAATRSPIIVTREDRSAVSAGAILDAGADDCIEEPFLMEEMAARVRRLLHRAGVWLGARTVETVLGPLEIDAFERRASLAGRLLELGRLEFELLLTLAGAGGRTLDHEEIQRKVWRGTGFEGRQNLRRLVSSLRRKIEPVPERPVCLLGVRGGGYRLASGGDEPEGGPSDQWAVRPKLTRR